MLIFEATVDASLQCRSLHSSVPLSVCRVQCVVGDIWFVQVEKSGHRRKILFIKFVEAAGREFLKFLWYSLLDTVTAESNGSEGMEGLEDDQMSEEMLALVDEFENSWPQEAFEGALEVKGHRMDLQGIRVLKKGSQDGLASSCFGDCGDDDEAEWVSLDEFT